MAGIGQEIILLDSLDSGDPFCTLEHLHNSFCDDFEFIWRFGNIRIFHLFWENPTQIPYWIFLLSQIFNQTTQLLTCGKPSEIKICLWKLKQNDLEIKLDVIISGGNIFLTYFRNFGQKRFSSRQRIEVKIIWEYSILASIICREENRFCPKFRKYVKIHFPQI